MTKSLIIGGLATITLLAGLLWLDSRLGSKTQPMGPSPLKAEEAIFDFREISMAKGAQSHAFNLTNRSNQAVTITKIETSCMCTTATLVRGEPSTGSGEVRQRGPFGMPGHGQAGPPIRETLTPHESVSLKVVFDPAAHGPAGLGPIERQVFIETKGYQKLTLSIKAKVSP